VGGVERASHLTQHAADPRQLERPLSLEGVEGVPEGVPEGVGGLALGLVEPAGVDPAVQGRVAASSPSPLPAPVSNT
jgi:hypothetical protein